MPFEGVLGEALVAGPNGVRRRSPSLRQTMLVASVAVHGVALAALLARGVWHVDELAPRAVAVTVQFRSARAPAPSPQPGPAPAAGEAGGRATSARVRRPPPTAAAKPISKPTFVAVAPSSVVSPAAPTPAAPEPAAAGSGAATTSPAAITGSGNGGGGPPGSLGGGGTLPGAPPKFLPEAAARAQRLSGAEPAFPALLAHAGTTYVVQAKLCVDADGRVDRLTLLRRADPTLDANVTEAVHGWRYRPLMVGDKAVPFCTFVRFEFRGE